MSIYDKIFPPKKYTLDNGKAVEQKRSRAPIYVILVLLMSYISIRVTGFDPAILAKRGNQFFVILSRMFPPEYGYFSNIVNPILDTVKMSLLGSALGSIICLPFAMLASTNICKNRFVVAAMRLIFSIVRTLPTLVSALIATFIFGLGTIAGTTAIAIFSFSYIGKIMYEEIETVDMGAFEEYPNVGMILLVLFVTVFIIESVSRYARKKLV